MKRHNWTEALKRAFASTAAVASIAAVLVVSTGSASAQDAPPPPPQGGGQGQGRGPGFGGPMMGGPGMGLAHSAQLLNRRDVSKDLGLTQDQESNPRGSRPSTREDAKYDATTSR